MKKKIPKITSDAQAEAFLAKDLSNLDFSAFKPVQFELKPKNKAISLRLSETLLSAVCREAKRVGIPYQRYIRSALERALRETRTEG